MPILEIDSLCKQFGGLSAVDNVCFTVEPKMITSLIGPNGAGKTTIFNLMSGLLVPTSGAIRLKGHTITGLLPQAICHLGIGRTFQEPRVFGNMTVLENVMIGRQHQSGENIVNTLLRPSRVRLEEWHNMGKALEMLKFVNLEDRASDPAHTLSYGQQRFLSIARVLASEPEVLLLDEPTVGLHPKEISQLMNLLVDLVRNHERTVLLIEHNMEVVMNISDWIVLLVQGTVVASGPPHEIKNNQTLLEAYLGASYLSTYASG